MIYSIVFIVLYAVSNVHLQSGIQTKVVMVQMVFRSGVRAVHFNYPKNQVPVNFWDKYGGLSQLTNVGMKQMHKFGINFKNLYPFLNPTYDRKRIVAKSIEKDRTLQSSYMFLTGLFSPSNDQRWIKDSNLSGYMPIPVYADNEIFYTDKNCDRYDYLRAKARNSNDWLKVEKGFKSFLLNMSNYSGLSLVDNLYDIWHLADNILVNKAHRIKQDKWIIENFHTIMHLKAKTYFIDFYNIEMAKLVSGAILSEILSNINNKVNKSTYELFIFGATEEHLVGLEKLISNYPSLSLVSPNFGAAIIFELRTDSYGSYYVQILFKNNNYPDPFKVTPMIINGCDTLCPLNEFLKLTNDKIVNDIAEACYNS